MAKRPPKPELHEIATLEKDYDLFSGYLQTMQNPDKVLRLEAAGDISVYDDIGRDAHIASVLRTRALAVVGREWEVLAASDAAADVAIAEFVKQVFLSFPFDASRRALLRGGVLKGYALGEVMWDVSEGDVTIRKILPRAQRRFRFDWSGRPRLLTLANMLDGEVLPEKKFQVFTFGDECDTPYGVGLGRELYWPWWFKKHGIKFWLIFSEKFGSPTPWGKYPNGTPEAEQTKLLEAMAAIQTDGALITPDTMSVELLEAARQGSVDTYEKLCEFMNKECSKSVIGQTATTEGTPGKLGNDKQQGEVRADLVKADADALCEAGNAADGVIRWLVDYNFANVRRYPKMWIRCEEEEDLKTLAERDQILSGLVPVPAKYFRDTYGLPEPQTGDELAKQTSAPTPPAPPLKGAHGGGGAAFAEPAPTVLVDDPVLDPLAQEMLGDWQPLLGPVVDPIRAALEGAATYQEALDRLDALDLDVSALTEALAKATFAARAAGDVNA